MAKKKSSRRYGKGDALDYVPFNIDNRPRNAEVRAIFDQVGFTTWRDVFVDWDTVTSDTLSQYRQNPYTSPIDLINNFPGLFRMGLVRILYNYSNGMYHAYILPSN